MIPSSYARTAARIEATGLAARGGFHPDPDDGVPPLPGGARPATVVLVGTVGGTTWTPFASSPEACDGAPNPLDRWTRRMVTAAGRDLGATPLFPFDGPPYLPFQRWAMRAEPVAPSPLGLLIHPVYGLWHAYRGALAFSERLDLPQRPVRARPCDTCSERPCLKTCPVGAFTDAGYDVDACIAHAGTSAGAGCIAAACLARRACPVGRDHGYGPAQSAFHTRAFIAANRPA